MLQLKCSTYGKFTQYLVKASIAVFLCFKCRQFLQLQIHKRDVVGADYYGMQLYRDHNFLNLWSQCALKTTNFLNTIRVIFCIISIVTIFVWSSTVDWVWLIAWVGVAGTFTLIGTLSNGLYLSKSVKPVGQLAVICISSFRLKSRLTMYTCTFTTFWK